MKYYSLFAKAPWYICTSNPAEWKEKKIYIIKKSVGKRKSSSAQVIYKWYTFIRDQVSKFWAIFIQQ